MTMGIMAGWTGDHVGALLYSGNQPKKLKVLVSETVTEHQTVFLRGEA